VGKGRKETQFTLKTLTNLYCVWVWVLELCFAYLILAPLFVSAFTAAIFAMIFGASKPELN
jgi:hypothetical protein